MKTYYLSPFLLFMLMICTESQADQIVVSVIAQNDDAEEDITGPGAGTVQRTSVDLEIGNDNGIERWVGLRFQNIAIPAGSTINSATIRFTSTDTDVGNLLVPIKSELSLNAADFGVATPLTGRNLTASSVFWDPEPWFPGNSGANTTTPNLASLVQAVVNQPNWGAEATRPIVFIIQNDPGDTSERIAVSWDGNPAQAARLTIDFTPGGGILLGDVNLDGFVNLLDVTPFVSVVTTGQFLAQADINMDGVVNLLDVAPFVQLLTGG